MARSPTVRDVTHEDADDVAQDLAALKAKKPLRPGPRCGTASAIDRISEAHPDLTEAVLRAINDPDVPAAAAAEFLTKHGGKMLKAPVVTYHRRRGTAYGCSCE